MARRGSGRLAHVVSRAVRLSTTRQIGERLRRAREARGVDLNDAARTTRIDRRYLEALERDAPPEEFPAPLFARAFLREYAHYLGLRAGPLVQGYTASNPRDEGPLIRRPRPPRGFSPWVRRATTLVSIAALAAIAVVGLWPESAVEDPPTRTDSPTPPAASVPASPPAGTPGPGGPVEVLRLRLRVVGGPCWIQVTEDGTDVAEGTEEPGFAETFSSRERIDVVLGNPQAARLVLEGRPVRLPDSGGVYAVGFVLDDGRIREVSPE
jgi:transcriptional regulator with XRE-family HTH domain